MAEYGMPFDYDSQAADPEEYQYSAAEQRMFNMAMFTNGVFPQIRIIQGSVLDPQVYVGQSLKVTAGSGLTVVVSKGLASLEGVQYINTVDKVISLESDATTKTIDIVIDLNLVTQKVQTIAQNRGPGIAVQNSLTRTAYRYQILIATVTLSPAASNVSPANIVDHRLNTILCPVDGKPLCGLVGSSMQADTRLISEQLVSMLQVNQSAFDLWFAGIKTVLDGDAIGNILNLINGLSANKADKSEIVTLSNSVAAKSAKAIAVTATLTSAGWAGNGPWTQNVIATGHVPASKVAKGGLNPVNYDQVKEWGKCEVLMSAEAANQVTFTATKQKPTMNLPVAIVIMDKA